MTVIYSRQRLYDVNHLGFLKAFLSGTVNRIESESEDELERQVANEFSHYSGIKNLIPLSRGRLAAYFGVKHSVSASRRKVVMSAFTIFDLVNMVRIAGGEPFFVDSEPESPHISSRKISEAIDENTAAVIITHYHSTNQEIQKIADLCKSRGVALIEDCAISLGARVDGAHVGSFGDFSIFSFGLFKFVSTYLGGGIFVRDDSKRQKIVDELKSWPRITSRKLLPHAMKSLKFSVLTQENIFSNLTFPLFRFGYTHNIDIIKRNAQNDPNPFLRNALPDDYKVRPSMFQLREFVRQIPFVEGVRKKRIINAVRYYENLKAGNIYGLPEKPDVEIDCYLNFPLLIAGDRATFVKDIMRSGFDLAMYYYRNCAEVDALREYYRPLPNITNYVDRLVFFPTYPAVTFEYIDKLTNQIAKLVQE